MQSRFAKFLLFIFFFSFCLKAEAQFNIGPAASAMGGAGRAAVDPSEVVFINPAGLAHAQRYFFNAHYAVGTHPTDPDYNQFGVALSDGSPGNILPGALTYVKRVSTYKNNIVATEQDIQIALAGFATHGLAIGLAAHRLLFQPNYGDEVTQTNANFGLLYTPAEWLGIGAVEYDFWKTDDTLQPITRVVPKLGLGLNFLFSDLFHIRLDAVRPQKFNDAGRTDVMAGLETFFLSSVVFRLGYMWKETADQTYLTTGLGYVGPRLSIDYAYQRDVRANDGGRHMFDLWLPF